MGVGKGTNVDAHTLKKYEEMENVCKNIKY